MRVTMELRNAERALEKITRLERAVRNEARRFVARGAQMLYETARTYTALTDHTLAQLAELGHPYARRFAPGTLHPDYLVHIQSGTLQAGLHRIGLIETDREIIDGVANSTWYDPYVQLGTVLMRARPYMAQTRADLEPVIREMAHHLLPDAVQIAVSGP